MTDTSGANAQIASGLGTNNSQQNQKTVNSNATYNERNLSSLFNNLANGGEKDEAFFNAMVARMKDLPLVRIRIKQHLNYNNFDRWSLMLKSELRFF